MYQSKIGVHRIYMETNVRPEKFQDKEIHQKSVVLPQRWVSTADEVFLFLESGTAQEPVEDPAALGLQSHLMHKLLGIRVRCMFLRSALL